MKSLAPLLLALTLAACAVVGEDWRRPEPPITQADWSLALPAGEAPAEFWAAWGDPRLPGLIREALDHNRDLRAAAARIAEARALARVADAAGEARVDAQASVTGDRQSEAGRYDFVGVSNPVVQWQAGFDARWELDLYGRLARQRQAAAADLEAVGLAREALAVSLAAEVADQWLALGAAQAKAVALSQRIAAAREVLKLVAARVKAGLNPELDLRRAEDQLALTEARLPAARAEADLALRRLGVLVGGQPDSLLSRLADPVFLPVAPPPVPAVLPAALLDRRPDLRAAEARAAAALARAGVAEGETRPRLGLAASLGTLAIGGGLLEARGLFASAGPVFGLPIYNAGALAASVEAADARRAAAVEEWRQAAVAAVAEVEGAALGLRQAGERQAALDRALAAEEAALTLSWVRFERGLTDFGVPLDTVRQRLATEVEAIDARSEGLRRRVALYKALGGGWSNDGSTGKGGLP